jgi:hypothetical protein
MPAKAKRRPSWNVRSVLVCDDVTQDKNEKWIIFGAYNGIVIIRRPAGSDKPPVLPKLTVFIGIQLAAGTYELEFDLVDPNTKPVLAGKVTVTGTDSEEVWHFALSWGPARFTDPGKYTIRLGSAGGKKRRIGDFVVRYLDIAAPIKPGAPIS